MSRDHGYLTRKYMTLIDYLEKPVVLDEPSLNLIEYYEFEGFTVGSMMNEKATLHSFHYNLDDFFLLEALDIISILSGGQGHMMIRKTENAIGKVMWHIEHKHIEG